MSVTVDANILIYASNESDRAHRPARELVDRLAGGPEIVYLFWPVLLGYIRTVTHTAVLPRPLTPKHAMENVAELLALTHVRSPGEEDGFWALFRAVAGDRCRGNLVSDAHIATLMRQHGVAKIYTRDRDFRRFDDITAHDPFE